MQTALWNKSTKQVFLGQLLTCILGIVAGIVGFFASAATAVATGAALMGGSEGASSAATLGVISTILNIAILVGYVLIFLGIMGMKNSSDGEIQKGVQNIWIATILNIVGTVFGLIPVISIVGTICNLIALIFLIIGYSALKNSSAMAAFSEKGAQGFKTLFTAEIIAIIGTVVGFIPIIGIIGRIACLVAFIMVLVGWKRVSTPVAE